MKNVFENTEKILISDSGNLIELAEIVNVNPRLLYRNADLSGVDLTSQDVSFLVGLNCYYDDAIMTAEQRAFLKENDSDVNWADGSVRDKVAADIRFHIVESYLVEQAGFKRESRKYQLLIEHLREAFEPGAQNTAEENFVSKIALEVYGIDGFKYNIDRQADFFDMLVKARLPITEKLLSNLFHFGYEFRSVSVAKVFPIKHCSLGFISALLGHILKNEGQASVFRVCSDVLAELPEISDKTAVFLLKLDPPDSIVVQVLEKLTDKSLVKEKVGLANLLAWRVKKRAQVEYFVSALRFATELRMACLGALMKSESLEVAIEALRLRSKEARPLGSLELSDTVYAMKDLDMRMRYARQAEHLLSEHQHRILVTEIEKIALNRPTKEKIKRAWPRHFGR